ncbi:MAG: diguanylate cyclase [Frankiales bacterium]|jgi:diguanylate cyclase (GGDEF)-like protein|nr:diguanylate cyclase [Frankiales bacterium]
MRLTPDPAHLASRLPDDAGAHHHVALRRVHRVLVAAVAGYALTAIPGARPAGSSALIDIWLQNGILVGACLVVLLRALFVPAGRTAWTLIGSGLALYTAGNILYFGYLQFQTVIPTPSVADVPWLCSYPCLYGGLVALVRSRVGVRDWRLWLDGLLAVAGISAVASIWLHFLLGGRSSAVLADVVSMAYPVGDLVQLMIIAGACALLGSRVDRALGYLAIGMVLFAVADTLYTIRIAENTYQPGTPLDQIWTVAAVLMAAAALRPEAARTETRSYGWAGLVIPTLFTISSLTVLVVATAHPLPVETTVLATATLGFSLGRAVGTFREVQHLAISRTEARTDELTGLGNRRQLQEVVSDRIAQLEVDQQLAVMLIDLDRFKEVNDAHGHTVGDALLVEVGARLSVILRRDDLLVRLGGDEFAVVLPDAGADEALMVAERMLGSLQEPFVIELIVLHIDASIGIAVCPDVSNSFSGLLHGADKAMYEAKLNGLGTAVFEADDNDGVGARRQLIHELRTAISDNQLVLHYQPQVSLRTGRTTGVEALVRWNHPERGLLYPDMFIPEAERYGVMRSLTTAVLALGLDQARVWRDAGTPVPVAVNVSAANLADPDLPNQIAAMLAVRGLDGTSLVIEVTETILMNDTTRALAVLNGLCALNIRISIDDYGTGYSSLARLRDLPIHELKLDRSFVADLHYGSRTAAIVESTVQLAHSLGLSLVAEGIETDEALQLLTAMNCDIGQGYYLGRPSATPSLDVRITT